MGQVLLQGGVSTTPGCKQKLSPQTRPNPNPDAPSRPPCAQVLIHENYRLLPNTAQNVSYSTDMWFDVRSTARGGGGGQHLCSLACSR